VLLTPVVAILLLRPTLNSRILAFLVFLLAGLSDLWDGQLARRRDQITDFGKIVDPMADKLLVLGLPLWALVILLGREILITTLRFIAARQGSVVPASPVGKRKALAQNIFVGSAILLVALQTGATTRGWAGAFWNGFQSVHEWFTMASLSVALALTIYSLVTYLSAFSRIFAGQEA
jgi:CDP-diacylglycerol--glycerol-3-phosphate 3-phosphatidyltransferase